MSLLAPWFLLGGLAIGIPVWVHLIRRQQNEPSYLPSLMFFRRMPVRTMSRQHLEHLLLLIARCLLILLLALAFARPFFASSSPIAAVAKSKLHLVMVDTSASMRYGDRAAKAKAAALDAIGKMGALDQAQLVTFDAEAHILNQASSDKSVLRALLDSEVKPGAMPTRYNAAFSAAEKIARASNVPVSATLITDSQKSGWTAGSELPRLANGGTVEWISIDDKPHANWAVADIRIAHETYASKYPRGVQVRVNSFGVNAPAAREVIFSLNGRELQRRKVEVPANGSVVANFDAFDLPMGISRGEVRMTPADDFPVDDIAYFTLTRREPYKLLFVSGASSDRPMLYFRQALGSGEDPAFTIETRSAALAQFGAVVLFNTSAAPAAISSELKKYVEDGGGLLIIPGDRTDWGALARSVGDLMPAKSGDKVYVKREGDQFITIGDFQRDHVVFQPFQGRAASGLTEARFFGYFKVAADPDAVLARFSSGDPAVVERKAGKGRVLLLASAPDNVWSDLPLRPGFVPLIKQMAQYLAQLPNDPAYYTVPATVGLRAVGTVLDPQGKRQESDDTISRSGQLKDAAAFAKLDQTGFYEIRRQGQSAYLAANGDARESDLTPLTSEDRALLTSRAAAGTEASAAQAASQTDKPTREEQEKRQSWWWTVLVIVALLAIVETFIANGKLKLPATSSREAAFDSPPEGEHA